MTVTDAECLVYPSDDRWRKQSRKALRLSGLSQESLPFAHEATSGADSLQVDLARNGSDHSASQSSAFSLVRNISVTTPRFRATSTPNPSAAGGLSAKAIRGFM